MSAVVVTGAASGMGRASVEHLRGLSDTIFAVDIHAPQIDGTIGVACDITDPAAIASLCAMVSEAGGLRALVHAAGISPTMDNARRVWEVNLLGTQLLLDGIDPLVGQGTAVVCFSSVAAHHVAPYVTPEQAALLNDPLGDDFLDRAVAAASDSGYAYGLSKVGVQWAVRRAASAWGPPWRPGRIDFSGADRHADGAVGVRQPAGDATDARSNAVGPDGQRR